MQRKTNETSWPSRKRNQLLKLRLFSNSMALRDRKESEDPTTLSSSHCLKTRRGYATLLGILDPQVTSFRTESWGFRAHVRSLRRLVRESLGLPPSRGILPITWRTTANPFESVGRISRRGKLRTSESSVFGTSNGDGRPPTVAEPFLPIGICCLEAADCFCNPAVSLSASDHDNIEAKSDNISNRLLSPRAVVR